MERTKQIVFVMDAENILDACARHVMLDGYKFASGRVNWSQKKVEITLAEDDSSAREYRRMLCGDENLNTKNAQ